MRPRAHVRVGMQVPFFDDSYAVDSANVGPYGTAIMRELLPAVESAYRGIGAGWARGVLGGSTGGWEAFAAQVGHRDRHMHTSHMHAPRRRRAPRPEPDARTTPAPALTLTLTP